jgi:hypothetical protein
MITSIDKFFFREYSKDYTCVHFADEVWRELTGEHLTGKLMSAILEGKTVSSKDHTFREIPEPCDPCLVLMRRPRCPTHIGVFYKGRVLHLHDKGVEFQPVKVAARYFTEVRYYR